MAADTQLVRRDHDGLPTRVEPAMPPLSAAADPQVVDLPTEPAGTPPPTEAVVRPRRDALGVASGLVGLALRLTWLAILLALLVGLLGLVGLGGRPAASGGGGGRSG